MPSLKYSSFSDLGKIAVCHRKAFPASLSSALGIRFVTQMLSWYLTSDKLFIFHLENNNGECIGYCGGLISDGTLGTGSASGMAQHTFRAAILAFLKHPWVLFHNEVRNKWPLIYRNIKVKLGLSQKNHFSFQQVKIMSKEPTVGLVVIGVDPIYQGKGYGSIILKEFERVAIENYGILKLYLSVKADNATAITAYEKNGWLRGEENDGSFYMSKFIAPLK